MKRQKLCSIALRLENFHCGKKTNERRGTFDKTAIFTFVLRFNQNFVRLKCSIKRYAYTQTRAHTACVRGVCVCVGGGVNEERLRQIESCLKPSNKSEYWCFIECSPRFFFISFRSNTHAHTHIHPRPPPPHTHTHTHTHSHTHTHIHTQTHIPG